MKKAGLVLLLVALVIGFFAFDLQQLLTLSNLKAGMAQFEAWRAEQPVLVGAVYLAVYVVVTALSLPGAVIMTLAGGALFGLFWGVVLVSFASTIGATLAFLVARYLFRDAVQKRFGRRLQALNKGVEKEGVFYLFTLRLVPVFPFFVINLLMGLTPMPARTFYWVSQVGMLAGTVVYVNAGTQLAKVNALGDIMSPSLLGSFALLGVFPLVTKKILAWIRRRKQRAQYTPPKKYDRNLIVIGAGAGGLVSAYIAAAVKAKVTLIEAHEMGGDCLNYGCVPSKALIKSAKVAHQMRHADQFGLEPVPPEFSFRKVMQRVHKVIQAVAPHDSIERYTGLGVEVIQGYARLRDPWTVEIECRDGSTQTLTTRSVILATGARPIVPPLPGIEGTDYVTSDTLWAAFAEMDTPPSRLVILGGGPIGCELAQSFARLGSAVTVVEMGERLLAREDTDVAQYISATLQNEGVLLMTDTKAVRCEKQGEQKVLVVQRNGNEEAVPFDTLLCAVGRQARLEGYGLEALGIETHRVIATNEYLETLHPNIYAVGDVAGPFQFTHAAAHHAWYAAVNALFGHFKRFKVDYRFMPWTTYTDPEVARLGLSEQDANAQSVSYEVTHFPMAELDRAIVDGATGGFVKVLTVPGKDRILGVTIVGDHAGDLLAEFVLAMKHGLGLNKILGTIHAYPGWTEANKYAAGEWKKAHAPQGVLRWLEKYHAWRLRRS